MYLLLAPATVLFALAADALHYRLRFFREPLAKVLARAGFVAGGLACAALAGSSLLHSHELGSDCAQHQDRTHRP